MAWYAVKINPSKELLIYCLMALLVEKVKCSLVGWAKNLSPLYEDVELITILEIWGVEDIISFSQLPGPLFEGTVNRWNKPIWKLLVLYTNTSNHVIVCKYSYYLLNFV